MNKRARSRRRSRRDPAWKDATNATTTWLLWASAVESAAIKKGADPYVVRETPRIRQIMNRAFNHGEPVWMAADEVAFVAKAAKKPRMLEPREELRRAVAAYYVHGPGRASRDIDRDKQKASTAAYEEAMRWTNAADRAARSGKPSRRLYRAAANALRRAAQAARSAGLGRTAEDRILEWRQYDARARGVTPPRWGDDREVAGDASRPARRDFDRKALLKSIDKDQKAAARAKVHALKLKIREAVALRRSGRAGLKEFCALERQRGRERVLALRSELKATIASIRLDVRGNCERARRAPSLEVLRLREELRAERKFQAEMRRIEAGNRARAGARLKGLARASVRRGESDDEVRQNIPADLIPLFERVKRSIKGSPRKTRTEEFLEYAEEHPGEEIHAIEDKTDALIADLERQQRAGRRDPDYVGRSFVNSSGQRLIATKIVADPGRGSMIEMTNRDRQTRSFYTPAELRWMIEKGALRPASDRDSSARRAHRHRSAGAPTFRQQRFISRKIRILVREGRSPRQAAAIAYRMAGVRPRPARRRHP